MKIILFIAILIPAIFQAQNKYELNFENAISLSEDSLKSIEKYVDQIAVEIKASITSTRKAPYTMEYIDCCEAIFEQNEDSSLVKITLNQNVFFPRGQSEIYFRNGKIIKVHELVLEHYSENEKGVTEYFLKDEVTLFDINKIAIVNTKKIKGDKLTSGDGDELTDKKLIEKLNSLTPERALHGTGDYEYFESAIQRVFLDKK